MLEESRKPKPIAVRRCARCSWDHDIVTFHPFRYPADDFSHYGVCPTTGEPILMRLVPAEDRGYAWAAVTLLVTAALLAVFSVVYYLLGHR